MGRELTRRDFFATLMTVPVMGMTVPAQGIGMRVSGRLIDSATDLQAGHFALCGIGTGTCSATDALGISVHPKNELFLKPLQSLVGQDVTISILPR